MEQYSVCKYTTQDGSPLSVCSNSWEFFTSLKDQRKGQRSLPPAPGHSVSPKMISIAKFPHLCQTISLLVHSYNELRLREAHAVLQHHRQTSKGTELGFGLVLGGGGKAGRFGVKLNVNWLPICYQKANEKCLLAQLPPKWSVDLWKIHNSGTSIRKNIIWRCPHTLPHLLAWDLSQ